MFFFGKNKKQETRQNLPQSFWIEDLEIDTGSWFQVYSACLGKMTAIQNAFGEQVVKGDWTVSFSEGVISFGGPSYPIQFIGSESNVSNTWLWAWENVNRFPDRLLQLAGRAKEIGMRWKLDPFLPAKFELDQSFNGHAMSVVLCGLMDKYCYYKCPHAQGAAFVAISGVPDSVFAPVDAQTFASITMQCIERPIDHKLFIEGFLTWNRTKYEWDGQTIIAHFADELRIEFETIEGFRRIKALRGLKAAPAPES